MDGPIGRVARELGDCELKLLLLHRELAIDRSDHNAAVPDLADPVDDQQVVIADPVVDHVVTCRPHEVGGRRVSHAQRIEVDGLFGVVRRRRRKAAGHRGEEQRLLQQGSIRNGSPFGV